MKALNLAGRPFRNERLAETLFALGAAALLAVTAWHALVIRDLLPARTSALHREVAALQEEEARLRQEARSLRTEAPPAPTLAQWNLVKELVDRRAFSWTGLFARLEDVIPRDVRLKSISPSVHKGQVELDVDAVVRAPEAGWEFVRVLESGGDFYDVYPRTESDREFSYSMRYRPQPRSAPVGPPAPDDLARAEPPAPSPSPAMTVGYGPNSAPTASGPATGSASASATGAGTSSAPRPAPTPRPPDPPEEAQDEPAAQPAPVPEEPTREQLKARTSRGGRGGRP